MILPWWLMPSRVLTDGKFKNSLLLSSNHSSCANKDFLVDPGYIQTCQFMLTSCSCEYRKFPCSTSICSHVASRCFTWPSIFQMGANHKYPCSAVILSCDLYLDTNSIKSPDTIVKFTIILRCLLVDCSTRKRNDWKWSAMVHSTFAGKSSLIGLRDFHCSVT